MSNPTFKPFYGLHCFFCGELLVKGEFFRFGTYPMCPLCYTEDYLNERMTQKEKEWHRNNPNWTEQDAIDEANYFKFGEC